MPIMSGTELIQAISEAGISIPILVITNLRRDQRQQLQELFPDIQVLEKPFDPDQLIDAVTNLIRAE
jgi:CheY-like chemotaxis protein